MATTNESFFRLLRCEALCHYEQNYDADSSIAEANRLTQHSSKPFVDKLQLRADVIDSQQHILSALKKLYSRSWLLASAFILLAALLGVMTTAQLINETQRIVNFYGVLLAVLGLNILALALWFISLMIRIDISPVKSIWEWCQQKLSMFGDDASSNDKRLQQSAAVVWLAWLGQVNGGRWLFYSITHAYWVSFLLGALAYGVLQLSTHHYTFIWETTILPPAFFVQFTEMVAWLPRQLGLNVPDMLMVQNSELAAKKEYAAAWALLLLGAISLYGILPRLVLSIFAFVRYQHYKKQWQPDYTQAYYRRLQQRLQSSRAEVIDEDEGEQALNDLPQLNTVTPTANLHRFIVAIEMANLPDTWPPKIADMHQQDMGLPFEDLGLVNDRVSLSRCIAALKEKKAQPLYIVAHLDNLPDRGVVRLLTQLKEATEASVQLVLSRRHIKISNDEINQRFEDWQKAALHAGLHHNEVSSYDI